MEVHADILSLAGVDHDTFHNSGEDMKVKNPEGEVRVFRRGNKLVYRTGNAVDWWGEFNTPDTRH